MLTILRRKTASPRVAVADVAAELGLSVIQPHKFGIPSASDDTMSLADAAELVERFSSAQEEQAAAWEVYLEACAVWEAGRTEAYRAAASAKANEGPVQRMAAGPAHQLAHEAGRHAAGQYEQTVPRPAWNGEVGYGNVARLLFADAPEARGAAS